MRTLLSATALAFCTLVVSSLRSNAADARARTHADATVAIRTFQFAPDTVRVKAGTRVVWTNADEIEHTITSGTPDKTDGRFNGAVNTRGATYSAVLEHAGSYRYFCDRHRFMNGTVIVTR
jgi:plastocyanin